MQLTLNLIKMNREQKQKIFNFLNDELPNRNSGCALMFLTILIKNGRREISSWNWINIWMILWAVIHRPDGLRWPVWEDREKPPCFRSCIGTPGILNQMYFYLSLDYIVQILGLNLNDVLAVYEEILGSFFEKSDKPVILFWMKPVWRKVGNYLKKAFMTVPARCLYLWPDRRRWRWTSILMWLCH